ncbi:GNAT family N-acetyltransferase [Microbacterium sp. YY-01]|uniref:GNAT family N-acetyltransferase n=1 Tax=Microbacterium sp. YY-01 TaxID=3421634 RepID=UPI003D16F564
MQPTILTTERLVLRAPQEQHIDAIWASCQDPEIPRWTTVPSPYTRDHAEGFIQQVATDWQSGSEAVWAMLHDEDLVGMIGLHRIRPHEHGGEAELGYWVSPAGRGQGFLTEAGKQVIDWGFDELGLARIVWRAVVGNIPSARSARALGFRYEGTLRQGLVSHRGRDDGWAASLLPSDDRVPADWPVLG